jgi:hypothetical protein
MIKIYFLVYNGSGFRVQGSGFRVQGSGPYDNPEP